MTAIGNGSIGYNNSYNYSYVKAQEKSGVKNEENVVSDNKNVVEQKVDVSKEASSVEKAKDIYYPKEYYLPMNNGVYGKPLTVNNAEGMAADKAGMELNNDPQANSVDVKKIDEYKSINKSISEKIKEQGRYKRDLDVIQSKLDKATSIQNFYGIFSKNEVEQLKQQISDCEKQIRNCKKEIRNLEVQKSELWEGLTHVEKCYINKA